MTNTDAQHEIYLEVDARNRVSLGRFGPRKDRGYLGSEEPDGTIVLRPAVVVSELELQMLANKDLVTRIEKNRADPSRLVKRQRNRA